LEKQSFFKVTAINVMEMPRRSKAPSNASELQYCLQHEWSAVFQQSYPRAQHSGRSGNTQKKQSALAMLQNFNTAHPA
jgi:hypothetical protein